MRLFKSIEKSLRSSQALLIFSALTIILFNSVTALPQKLQVTPTQKAGMQAEEDTSQENKTNNQPGSLRTEVKELTQSFEVTRQVLDYYKSDLDHMKSVIDIASLVLGILIAGFGIFGVANIFGLRNEVHAELKSIRAVVDKEICDVEKSVEQVSKDLKERQKEWGDNLAEKAQRIQSKLDVALTDIDAKMKEHERLTLELKNFQTQLTASFQSFVAIVAAKDQLDRRTVPGWRRAGRYIDKVLKQLKPVEPELIRSAHAIMGVVEKRLIDARKALETVEAVLKYDEEGLLHYNAACYACLAGQQDKWQRYLGEALRINADYREDALRDEDFESVRGGAEFRRVTQ